MITLARLVIYGHFGYQYDKITHRVPGPLFTKQTDVLPQDVTKSRDLG